MPHIPPVVAGHISRTMGMATGTYHQCSHTGAVESIIGISVTITRKWLNEGVHDVGCCGRIADRDKHPNFPGTRELSSAQCRWRVPLSHFFLVNSLLATGIGVHRIRQRSDVDIVEKSACIESGRQYLSYQGT